MPWIDITRTMDETLLTWPGRELPHCQWEKRIATGHHCNVSFWEMSAHTGTHMDAPLHFAEGGKSIDQIAPEVFLGRCRVLDLAQHRNMLLDEEDVLQYKGAERLLIKTSHSHTSRTVEYPPHEALMTEAAVSLLIDGGLIFLGTDRLSVDDSHGKSFELHHVLLGAGCVIVEGLLLNDVSAGEYSLMAMPLKFAGAEASPIRAFLEYEG